MDQDAATHVGELRTLVREFVDERDWNQFHSPKNLSMAMSIEVAELMEHFQWISTDESRESHLEETNRQSIREELADVLCYVLAMANEMNIDLTTALRDKMVKNRQKYPVEEFHGKF